MTVALAVPPVSVWASHLLGTARQLQIVHGCVIHHPFLLNANAEPTDSLASRAVHPVAPAAPIVRPVAQNLAVGAQALNSIGGCVITPCP